MKKIVFTPLRLWIFTCSILVPSCETLDEIVCIKRMQVGTAVSKNMEPSMVKNINLEKIVVSLFNCNTQAINSYSMTFKRIDMIKSDMEIDKSCNAWFRAVRHAILQNNEVAIYQTTSSTSSDQLLPRMY